MTSKEREAFEAMREALRACIKDLQVIDDGGVAAKREAVAALALADGVSR